MKFVVLCKKLSASSIKLGQNVKQMPLMNESSETATNATIAPRPGKRTTRSSVYRASSKKCNIDQETRPRTKRALMSVVAALLRAHEPNCNLHGLSIIQTPSERRARRISKSINEARVAFVMSVLVTK